jgi:hypothetical protein
MKIENRTNFSNFCDKKIYNITYHSKVPASANGNVRITLLSITCKRWFSLPATYQSDPCFGKFWVFLGRKNICILANVMHKVIFCSISINILGTENEKGHISQPRKRLAKNVNIVRVRLLFLAHFFAALKFSNACKPIFK